jgi:hypothetical protein
MCHRESLELLDHRNGLAKHYADHVLAFLLGARRGGRSDHAARRVVCERAMVSRSR